MKQHVSWWVLLSALVLSLTTLTLGPASAATSGAISLTTRGGFVGTDACQEGPPGYRLEVDESLLDSSYYDWSADITITGPRGFYDTDFLWDEEGWNDIWFCDDRNVPGTYRVTAEVTIDHDGYSTTHSISETLQVTGPARSSVTYVKKTLKAHGWKFSVKATRAGRAWANKSVVLQGQCFGSWQKLEAKETNRRGRVTFRLTPKAGWNSQRFCEGVRGDRMWFRFYVKDNWNTLADTSRRFHVTRR